uniref:Cytochrome P450 n=1 Tax=Tetranychus urticae TaxID=32264 RepID=T1JYM1_TETUR
MDVLINQKEASSSSKRPVNIVDYIHLTSMDIICKTAMGISPEAQFKPSSLVDQAVTWMTKECSRNLVLNALSLDMTIRMQLDAKNSYLWLRNSILEDNIENLSYNQIHQFNYLDQCIKEGLRLFPPVPMIARELDQEVILDGFKIPKGASVAIMIYTIHRDPSIYPDPDSFNPGRFDSDHISSIPAYAYIPSRADQDPKNAGLCHEVNHVLYHDLHPFKNGRFWSFLFELLPCLVKLFHDLVKFKYKMFKTLSTANTLSIVKQYCFRPIINPGSPKALSLLCLALSRLSQTKYGI